MFSSFKNLFRAVAGGLAQIQNLNSYSIFKVLLFFIFKGIIPKSFLVVNKNVSF
jgi:hypothetical protein